MCCLTILSADKYFNTPYLSVFKELFFSKEYVKMVLNTNL